MEAVRPSCQLNPPTSQTKSRLELNLEQEVHQSLHQVRLSCSGWGWGRPGISFRVFHSIYFSFSSKLGPRDCPGVSGRTKGLCWHSQGLIGPLRLGMKHSAWRFSDPNARKILLLPRTKKWLALIFEPEVRKADTPVLGRGYQRPRVHFRVFP